MQGGSARVSTLLVNGETDTLFVGSRDAGFALDLNNISRGIARVNEKHLYFSPPDLLYKNSLLVVFVINQNIMF